MTEQATLKWKDLLVMLAQVMGLILGFRRIIEGINCLTGQNICITNL